MPEIISKIGYWITRLMLGDPSRSTVKPSLSLQHAVAAYGECIAVLIASTRTYVDQKLDGPFDPKGPTQAQLAKCKERIDVLAAALGAIEADGAWVTEVEGRSMTLFERYVELDAQLIAIIPGDFLVARRWILLDRMRRVAPQKALIEYEGSLPPSMDKGFRDDSEKIRADLLSLSTYMQQLYILNARREQTLASIKWWLLSRVIGVVLVIAVIFWLATTPVPGHGLWGQLPWMPTGLMLVFLTGMIGAVVSISRKFQDIGGQNILVADPFNELMSLNFSRESIAASVVSGGVFALVFYLMVISGSTEALGLDVRFFPSLTEQRTIVDVTLPAKAEAAPSSSGQVRIPKSPEGDAKPAKQEAVSSSGQAKAFKSPEGAANKPEKPTDAEPKNLGKAQYAVRENDRVPTGIEKLSKALGFFYNADILRMMLLAFLAGFAERLVPDSIDRLVRKEKAVKDAAV